MYAGEGFLLLALLVWMGIAIGPWYVPVILFIVTATLNVLHITLLRRSQEKVLKSYQELLNTYFKK